MSGNWNFDAPLIRLATIYLVYAEAVTRSKGAAPEVYNQMHELRARSFMAPIPPAAQTNKELLLDYILRERRVELYHEKSRFFSTRFYLEPTSPEELAKDAQWSSIQGTNDQKAQLYFDKYGAYPKTQHRICGMRPEEAPNGKLSISGKTYRMERFWKEDRVFLEKHYLFPIPTEELQRANIPQNPNWYITITDPTARTGGRVDSKTNYEKRFNLHMVPPETPPPGRSTGSCGNDGLRRRRQNDHRTAQTRRR